MKTLNKIVERDKIVAAVAKKVKDGSKSGEDCLYIFLGPMMNPDDDNDPKYLHHISIKDGRLEFVWGDAINALSENPVVQTEDMLSTEELGQILNWLNLPALFPFQDREDNQTHQVHQHDINLLVQIVGKHDILTDLTREDEDGEIVCTEEELRQIASDRMMTTDLAYEIIYRMEEYTDDDDLKDELAMSMDVRAVKAYILSLIEKRY